MSKSAMGASSSLSVFSILPVPGATMAKVTDTLFYYVLGATSLLGILVFTALTYFCWRYRASVVGKRSPDIRERQRLLEVIWIMVPLILVMTIFGFSARAYYQLMIPPRDAMDVYVIAKQWMWKFYSPGGVAEIGRLHVPVNKPVRLVMTSEDVIHSFFVPDFRVKQDVLPFRYTSLWFTPTLVGHFHVLCTQYCGMSHSAMDAWIDVDSATDYENWHRERAAENGQNPAAYEGKGRFIYARYGCESCHGDRNQVMAPSLKGLFGRMVTLADGREWLVDENYVRESINEPNNKIVKGYKGIMPSYAGQISEGEMVELVKYVRGLGGRQ